MKRAYSVNQLAKMKPEVLEFDGPFKKLLGQPEPKGVWIIWGASANGKTRFCLQLAKYLSGFKKVCYNPLEEGIGNTLRRALHQEGLVSERSTVLFVDRETIAELKERMSKRRSPAVYFIDSIQYTQMSTAEYVELKEFADTHNKLLVFNSHANGKNPKGSLAEFVRYDAHVKIRVEGFKAFATSRHGGDQSYAYTIYEKGAKEYWG